MNCCCDYQCSQHNLLSCVSSFSGRNCSCQLGILPTVWGRPTWQAQLILCQATSARAKPGPRITNSLHLTLFSSVQCWITLFDNQAAIKTPYRTREQLSAEAGFPLCHRGGWLPLKSHRRGTNPSPERPVTGASVFGPTSGAGGDYNAHPAPIGKAETIEQSRPLARHSARQARLSAAAILSEAAEPARPPSRARALLPLT